VTRLFCYHHVDGTDDDSEEAQVMSSTNCPHCGAPAGTGFFCDACGGAMFSSGGAARPEAAAAQPAQPAMPPPDPSSVSYGEPPEYVSPGDARAAARAYPPGAGQVPPPGYPLPPGTVPYRPMPRTAPKGLVVSRKAFIIGVVGFLVLILATLGVVLLLKPDKAPKIIVPAPPGMTEETGVMRDMEENSIEESFQDGKLAAYCTNYDTYDTLIAFSFDSSHYTDVPPQDASLEEMQDWVDQNSASLSEDFVNDFAKLLEINPSLVELESLDVVETSAGDVAIHVELFYYDQKSRASAGLNVLTFSKSDTIYMVMLLNFGGGTEAGTMNYLKDNIDFE
jgi:hypothetical protein